MNIRTDVFFHLFDSINYLLKSSIFHPFLIDSQQIHSFSQIIIIIIITLKKMNMVRKIIKRISIQKSYLTITITITIT